MNTYTLEEGRQKAAGAVCAAFRRKGRREYWFKARSFFITDPSEHDIRRKERRKKQEKRGGKGESFFDR
ncbi:MAG: hypothetical protein F6K17_00005 [Okeania sp. SIO3C4]|nr:hypothetical protein [Okeania sp. SIO3B3]NER01156.1 hypothetical protein [Okeania sp. SIO3C4]